MNFGAGIDPISAPFFLVHTREEPLCGVQCGHHQILRDVQAHLAFGVYCKEAPPAGTLPDPEVFGRSTECAKRV